MPHIRNAKMGGQDNPTHQIQKVQIRDTQLLQIVSNYPTIKEKKKTEIVVSNRKTPRRI